MSSDAFFHAVMGLMPLVLCTARSDARRGRVRAVAHGDARFDARLLSRSRQGGVTPRGARARPAFGRNLIYLHGLRVPPWSCGAQCRSSRTDRPHGLPVIIPDSPLALAHTASDAFSFVQTIIDGPVEFSRVIVCGDWREGGLALSLPCSASDAGARRRWASLLYAPWARRDDDEPRRRAATGSCACPACSGRGEHGPVTRPGDPA